MMCYKDMTFCPAWIHERCTDSAGCELVLDDKVKEGAVKWWGSDEAPICIFVEEPECFKEEEDGLTV